MDELITREFAEQCIAFPSRVDTALAEITTVTGAKDLLDKAAAMQHYADRLKAGIEVQKPIAVGVLKIKTKLGELLPEASKGGRGNKGVKQLYDFTRPTAIAYRKMAANAEKLGALNRLDRYLLFLDRVVITTAGATNSPFRVVKTQTAKPD